MTFDELVATTHARLRGVNSVEISVDAVWEILESAEVATLMRRSDATFPNRRIVLREVWLHGRKHVDDAQAPTAFTYRRRLTSGINGWFAGNSAGKSTLLKTMVWAVTGSEPAFKADVRAWLDDVAVEFEITGDGIYTIRYQPRTDYPKVVGTIFNHPLDVVLKNAANLVALRTFKDKRPMTEIIAAFFAERLGFFSLEAININTATFSTATRVISWDVYAQALFIGAEDYGDFLFSYRDSNANQHQNTLAMLLGLDATAAVARLKMNWEKAKSDWAFQRRRVEENARNVKDKITNAQAQLKQVEARIAEIDAGQSVVVDATYVAQIREQIASHLERIKALSEQEEQLLDEENQAKADLAKLRREAQVLRETIQFRYFFSGIPVERCPHCEQAITQDRIEQERRDKLCRLCGNDLRPATSSDQHEQALAAMDKHIERLKHTLRGLTKDVRAVHTILDETQKAIKPLQASLADLPRQERAGFTTELRELLSLQGFWRGQLQELRVQTAEGQAERMEGLQHERVVFEEAYKALQAAVSREYRTIMDKLEERITTLAQSFGIRNLNRVFFTPQFELIVRQSGKNTRYGAMDTSEALRIKLAFHLALLTLRSSEGIGRHPGMLIIDAPGNGEMDRRSLEAIVQCLSSINTEIGSGAQILIATTHIELADICDQDGVVIVEGGAPLF